MSTHTEQMSQHSVTWHEWLSWIGIVVALIGFFFWIPIILGIVGAILGIISASQSASASTNQKTWSWIAIIVGIIVLILGILGWTVAGMM